MIFEKLRLFFVLLVLGSLVLDGHSARAQMCEQGHWIESVIDDGRLIRLEDGSLWQVDPFDVLTSTLWLPVSDIVICGNRLINVDDDESVHARRLR
jgi:hypothetical protein